MASVNRVILLGNLGQAPEIRSFANGGKIAAFSVATSETWKDKQSGERKEKTEWHNIVLQSDGLVNVAERYLKKGSKVYIEGQLRTRKWADQSGNDRYSTEVVVGGFDGKLVMLDGANGNRTPDGSQGSSMQHQNQDGWGGSSGFDQALDDEVPFASCNPALEWRVR